MAAGIFTLSLIGNDGSYFSGMVLVDNYSVFFRLLFLIIGGLTILSFLNYLDVQALKVSESYALILFATIGMNMMVASNELIMIIPGAGDSVYFLLYSDWNPQDRTPVERSSPQILPLGLLFLRFLPLWDCASLWWHWKQQHRIDLGYHSQRKL